MGFGLSGGMIPRKVRRWFEERAEPRLQPDQDRAVLGWRGQSWLVRLGNVSSGGAMLLFDQSPHIGEQVSLQMLDRSAVAGQVRWVRDGRIGINFNSRRG